VLDAETGSSFDIKSGNFEFSATGGDGVAFEVTPQKVVMSRGDKKIVNVTKVEAAEQAGLKLSVLGPNGQYSTGAEVTYRIMVHNSGKETAKDVELLMQFSEGVEPVSAEGHTHTILPGQLQFAPIDQIEAGQRMEFEVAAVANKQGTHVYRAFVSSDEAGSRQVKEGSTSFPFTDEAAPSPWLASEIERNTNKAFIGALEQRIYEEEANRKAIVGKYGPDHPEAEVISKRVEFLKKQLETATVQGSTVALGNAVATFNSKSASRSGSRRMNPEFRGIIDKLTTFRDRTKEALKIVRSPERESLEFKRQELDQLISETIQKLESFREENGLKANEAAQFNAAIGSIVAMRKELDKQIAELATGSERSVDENADGIDVLTVQTLQRLSERFYEAQANRDILAKRLGSGHPEVELESARVETIKKQYNEARAQFSGGGSLLPTVKHESVYGGRNFDQWLRIAMTDKQPKTVADAMKACGVLAETEDQQKRILVQLSRYLKEHASMVIGRGNSEIHMSGFVGGLGAFPAKEKVGFLANKIRSGSDAEMFWLSQAFSEGLWGDVVDDANKALRKELEDRAAELLSLFSQRKKFDSGAGACFGMLIRHVDKESEKTSKTVSDVLLKFSNENLPGVIYPVPKNLINDDVLEKVRQFVFSKEATVDNRNQLVSGLFSRDVFGQMYGQPIVGCRRTWNCPEAD